MQEIYFSGYSDLDRIPGVGKVAGILNDENYYNLTRAPLVYDKNYELKLERMAVLTGDWRYYDRLLEVRSRRIEAEAARKEILEKYPYDGKSTFSELLAEEISKIGSKK